MRVPRTARSCKSASPASRTSLVRSGAALSPCSLCLSPITAQDASLRDVDMRASLIERRGPRFQLPILKAAGSLAMNPISAKGPPNHFAVLCLACLITSTCSRREDPSYRPSQWLIAASRHEHLYCRPVCTRLVRQIFVLLGHDRPSVTIDLSSRCGPFRDLPNVVAVASHTTGSQLVLSLLSGWIANAEQKSKLRRALLTVTAVSPFGSRSELAIGLRPVRTTG